MTPMYPGSLTYRTPESIEGAMEHFISDENARFLAGGTDLIPLMKRGGTRPRSLIDLGRIQALKGVSERKEGLSVGAMATLTEVVRDPIVSRDFPALAEAARSVGSPQIRNRGTTGGNLFQARRCLYLNQTEYWRSSLAPCFATGGKICHQAHGSSSCRALYCSDLAPALLAYDASAEVFDAGGVRMLSLKELIHDHGSGEYLLTGIFVPYPTEGTQGKFIKLSVRGGIDFPVVNLAVRHSPVGRQGQTEPLIRIFVGAASQEPFALDETARYIVSNLSEVRRLQGEIEERALKELNSKSSPIRETAISVRMKRKAFHLAVLKLRGWAERKICFDISC